MIPSRGSPPLPPALRQVDPWDVSAVLDEFPTDFGMLLWKAVRAADLWAQTPVSARRSLFPEGSQDRWQWALTAVVNPPASAHYVRDLFRELRRSEGKGAEAIASLCLRIAEWAEGEGALATAVAFAEAAALALPRAPQPALTAGRVLKRRGAYSRAEIWLQRSLALAVAAGDWAAVARAWSEIGTVFALKGNLRAAKVGHLRALRIAVRHHLLPYVGIALHDLCALLIQTGDAAGTQKYAQLAIRAYYPGHPRLAVFASDMAYFWMLHGEFECALRVFLAVLPRITDRREQLFVGANIIRAAGGAGCREVFDAFWQDTLNGIRECKSVNGQAAALLDLAHGAASLREWERADEAATEAIQRARELGEGKTVLEGDAVLESVRRHMTVAVGGEEKPPTPLTNCSYLADTLEAFLVGSATAH